MTTRRFLLVLALISLLAPVSSRAHPPTDDMAEAANNLLVALTPEQRTKATFEFKDEERVNWHFVPRERKGLPLKEMTPSQRHLAHGLLNSALSQRGYLKATTIMSLEEILLAIEQGRGPTRDPDLYFFSVFGTPDAKGTWGWRVEGHHLAFNFIVVAGKAVSVTPTFMGSNPGEVREGPRKGLRVLAGEEDLGRQLAKSLNAEQRKAGIFSETAPRDIITGNSRKAKVLEPMGLAATAMTPEQRVLLWQVIEEYVRRFRSELADLDLKRIEIAGRDKIHFAWAGSLEPKQGHYYRIQGPTFLIEYDNTQNNANHVHSVWRDLENDFGDDLLRKHYEQTPHKE